MIMKKLYRTLYSTILGLLLTTHSYPSWADQKTDISIIAMGDTMPGNDVSKLNANLLGEATSVLSRPFDIAFFNFEGTMGIKGVDDRNPKCSHGLYCYTFMVNPEALTMFEKIKNPHSQWIFNMANNHSMDYGQVTQEKTYNYLSQQFSAIGLPNHPYKIIEINHQKVALIGASPHHGTVSIFDDYLYDEVKELKSQGNIVIVSLHMGAEGADRFMVTKHDEIFAGGNRGNVYEVAHHLINEGADLILVHGPHVLRGLEVYQHRLITYSLGNFLTYGQFSLSGNTSYGGILGINLHDDGSLDYASFYPTQQTKSVNPVLWNKGVALIKNEDSYQFLKKISKENFPLTSPVFISPDKIMENSGKKCAEVECDLKKEE
jgi:hypothetical protein